MEELSIHLPIQDKRAQLLKYYDKNRKRMQYHHFVKDGLQIGSGAKSAHKNVLQAGLKLLGQRWTREGLQQMPQLRVIYKSGQWNRIRKLYQKIAV